MKLIHFSASAENLVIVETEASVPGAGLGSVEVHFQLERDSVPESFSVRKNYSKSWPHVMMVAGFASPVTQLRDPPQ